MKTAAPITADAVYRAVLTRRQNAARILEELPRNTAKADVEAARKEYNAATGALDRLVAKHHEELFR